MAWLYYLEIIACHIIFMPNDDKIGELYSMSLHILKGDKNQKNM